MANIWEKAISIWLGYLNWGLRYIIFTTVSILSSIKGLFKYYIIKEVGGWGQKMTIFADLQYYLLVLHTIYADVVGWVGLKMPRTC